MVSEGGQIAVPANLNAPGQIAIAGDAAAVRRAIDIAKERGATMSVELKVSAPFHCPLMKPAQDGMTPILRGLNDFAAQVSRSSPMSPRAPNSDPAKVADLLIEQITAPVRWIESMEQLGKLGVTDAIEFGCGKVLMGLMRRINKNHPGAPARRYGVAQSDRRSFRAIEKLISRRSGDNRRASLNLPISHQAHMLAQST